MFLQQLVTGISVGGIYALLATGYSLIYSLLDFSNWAHGEFAMVSAYIAIVLSSFMGMPFVLAGRWRHGRRRAGEFSLRRFAYRRIRRNGAPNMFLMIAAMGLSNVFQQAANLIFSGQYRSYPFKLPVSTIKVASAYIGVLDLVSLAITAVIITILVYLINKTQFGLNVRAIACNAHAAKVLGVKVDRCIATVFVLAGALAGVAGVLYGMKYNVFPTMGNVGLKAFIASVIGGLGSVPGAIVGSDYSGRDRNVRLRVYQLQPAGLLLLRAVDRAPAGQAQRPFRRGRTGQGIRGAEKCLHYLTVSTVPYAAYWASTPICRA